MSDTERINLAGIFGKYENGIRIPEIQRDYVMGSGGEKLNALLKAIDSHAADGREFYFSSIITYCKSENDRLEIYDGQQRLTTLYIMYLFALHREGKSIDDKFKNGWYEFSQRDVANEILKTLADENFEIDKINVCDFTSFSIRQLLNEFSKDIYPHITSDYLLNKVCFDKLSLGCQSEVEQFFMDLNSGVKLKPYELYKAKLVHYINNIGESTKNNKVMDFQYKIDNEWLDVFMPFASFENPAEEYEIAFIRYCFDMLCIQNKCERLNENDNFRQLTEEIICMCYDILEGLIKVDFRSISYSNTPYAVEFAWGNRWKECTSIHAPELFDEKRGAYWNLKYENYVEQLHFIISNHLLKDNDGLLNDLVIWGYVSTLKWRVNTPNGDGEKYQREYLRILKVLLNRDVRININAWYASQEDGQYLYYSKYSVRNIPNYYGVHISDTDKQPQKEESLFDVFLKINRQIVTCEQFQTEPVSGDDSISLAIMNAISNMPDVQRPKIIDALNVRNTYIQYPYNPYKDNYPGFCDCENEYNGLLIPKMKDSFYLANVTLSYRTRSDDDVLENQFVLLKCRMDKAYSSNSYSVEYDNAVKQFVAANKDKYKEFFDVDKCFWKGDNETKPDFRYCYRLGNRLTKRAKTYERIGKDYWAYRFSRDGGDAYWVSAQC